MLLKQLEAREIGIPLVRTSYPTYKRKPLPKGAPPMFEDSSEEETISIEEDDSSELPGLLSLSEEDEELDIADRTEENNSNTLKREDMDYSGDDLGSPAKKRPKLDHVPEDDQSGIDFDIPPLVSSSEEDDDELPVLVDVPSDEDENIMNEECKNSNSEDECVPEDVIEGEEEEDEEMTDTELPPLVSSESDSDEIMFFQQLSEEEEDDEEDDDDDDDDDDTEESFGSDHICCNCRKRIKEQTFMNEEDSDEDPSESEISENTFAIQNTFKFMKNHYNPYSFREQISAHSCFVKRFEQFKKLKGHTGCVNTINWSMDGNFLLSGGDDTTLAIWDYDKGGICRRRINTGHSANIFSAKFLPNGTNDVVISCARDGKVMAFNIEHGPILPHAEAVRPLTGIPLLDCTCHDSEVKRLTIDKNNPNIFQSCGGDGRVFLYDIRQNHECNEDSRNVLVDIPRFEIYSMDANPINSNEFVISGTSQFISLYDKR